jgi:hypothetical protein
MATQKAIPKKKASLNTIKKELKEKKIETAKETRDTQPTVFAKAKKLKRSARTSVLNRSKRIEKWHKKTAGLPFERLFEFKRLEEVAGDIIAIQNKTIGHGYDLARTVVTKVCDITDEILDRAEKRLAA